VRHTAPGATTAVAPARRAPRAAPQSPQSQSPKLPTTTKMALFVLGLCALLGIYSTQPILPDLAHALGVPTSRGTWTISATTLGVAAVAPFAGAAADRLGRKRVMLAAVAATLVATLACAGAWSFASLLVFRFAQGLFIPFVFAVALSYAAEEFTGPQALQANALYVSGTAFGGFCGRFFAGAAATWFGWRASFVALAAVLGVAMVITACWLPPERRFRRTASLWASLRGTGRQVKDARLLGTCVIGAALLFQQVGSFTYAGLHLAAAPFRLSTFAIGTVFAVFLVAVVVTPLAGRMIVRAGKRRTFLLFSLVSAGGLALTLVPSAPAVVAGLAASSTGVFAGQACATGYAAGAGGPARGGAVGWYLTFYYAGGSIGAVAPGPVYDGVGWGACVALLAAVVAAGAVTATAAWRTDPASTSEPPIHNAD
jgi:MFS transporter, YNFM family, putative membrane transport protein